MSDNHEGPVHQAYWVFPLTLFSSYAFLVLVMGAKWAADDVNAAVLFKVFGVQAAVLLAFLFIFGGIIYIANKLVGAMDATE